MVATLTFAKQIAFLLVEDNRYFFLWRFTDSLGVILDLVILISIVVALTLASRRWPLIERIWNRVLVLAFTSGLLTLLPTWLLPPMSLNAYRLWIVAIIVTAVSFVWRRLPVVPFVAGVSMILSPLIPILLFQLVTASTWSTSAESAGASPRPQFASSQAGERAVPIFLFVFDEWSVKRTTANGEFLPEYPNSRALAAQSLTFSEAWSYSTRSYHSLPALLFQNDQRIQIGPGMTFWEDKGQNVPTSSLPSLLGRARQAGYHTALQGFYLPYKRILGEQVEYERSRPVFPRGYSLSESMKLSAVRNLQWIVEPFAKDTRRRYEAGIQSRWWYEINQTTLDESLQLIDAAPRNIMAFFHWPLPHGPFVINADGTYNEQYPLGGILDGLHGPHAQLEDYQRHLKYHDTVLGKIVEELKRSGKFDDALIIMTADHSWRPDPMEKEPNWVIDPSRRRVPLVIKLPHQQSGRLLSKTVYNNLSLEPIVEAAINGAPLTESDVVALIDRMPDLPTPTGKNSTRPTTPPAGAGDGPTRQP